MNKKLLTIAIAGAMAAPMSAQAINYKLSGQVNRAVSFMDDGAKSDVRSSDNGASNTRFRMRGDEDLGNGMKVGAYIELGVNSSPSGTQKPDLDATGDSASQVTIRQSNVWFSGNWGKLTMGHTSEAQDGTTGSDLSGTNLTHSGAGRTDNSGAMVWQGTGPSAGATFSKQGSTYSKLDGGRRDVIRYDTPKIGPVGLAASVANDQSWSVGASLNTGLGGGELSAALGYRTDTGRSTVEDRFGGSLSYLFSQGTSISGHYATEEKVGGRDLDSFSISLGHKWGPHAVEATYSEGNDIAAEGFTDTGYAIEYVHTLKKANTRLYAGYLHAELDGPSGTSWEDQDIFTVGAVVKFD